MPDIKNITDEQIVEIVRTQNKETYSEIINRYQEKLVRYAYYLTQDNDKAADVVQDTFIKAYINLNGFNVKKKFSSWIYRIAHNEAMNIIRRNSKQMNFTQNVDFESNIHLEDDFIRQEFQDKAHNCLKNMPLMYREPLMLFFLDDRSYNEISDILRIPVGTVGTRINRAKVIMRKICKEIKK